MTEEDRTAGSCKEIIKEIKCKRQNRRNGSIINGELDYGQDEMPNDIFTNDFMIRN
jgi:hypothetical protein